MPRGDKFFSYELSQLLSDEQMSVTASGTIVENVAQKRPLAGRW